MRPRRLRARMNHLMIMEHLKPRRGVQLKSRRHDAGVLTRYLPVAPLPRGVSSPLRLVTRPLRDCASSPLFTCAACACVSSPRPDDSSPTHPPSVGPTQLSASGPACLALPAKHVSVTGVSHGSRGRRLEARVWPRHGEGRRACRGQPGQRAASKAPPRPSPSSERARGL